MNYLQQARESLPELMQLLKAHEAAQNELKKPAENTMPTHAEIAARAREALLSGQPVDPTTGAQLFACDTFIAEVGEQRTLLRDLADGFKHEAEEYERAYTSPMIEGLKPHLQRILGETREAVTGLGGARTAEEAIQGDTSVLAAWQALTAIANDYSALRDAHWKILRIGWSHYDTTMDLSNPTHGAHTAVRAAEKLWDRDNDKLPPWPCDELRPMHAPKADRAFLLWAVEHGDHVWLPTVPEVIAETERYAEAVKPEPAKLHPDIVRQDESRRRAQRIVGGAGFVH